MFGWATSTFERLAQTVAPPPADPPGRFVLSCQNGDESGALAALGELPSASMVVQQVKGQTPLHLACLHAMPNLIRHVLNNMIQQQQPITITDYGGNTALHCAAMSVLPHTIDVVKFLIAEYGASVTAKNADGQTPYDVAVISSVRQYLLPLQLQEETRVALDNGGVGLPPGIDLGGLKINYTNLPPPPVGMPGMMTGPPPQLQPPPIMGGGNPMSSPPSMQQVPPMAMAPAPQVASVNNESCNPPFPPQPQPGSGIGERAMSAPSSANREYSLRGYSSAAMEIKAPDGRRTLKPDGFHSSSSDKRLQQKYGHQPINRPGAVPPPPRSGNHITPPTSAPVASSGPNPFAGGYNFAAARPVARYVPIDPVTGQKMPSAPSSANSNSMSYTGPGAYAPNAAMATNTSTPAFFSTFQPTQQQQPQQQQQTQQPQSEQQSTITSATTPSRFPAPPRMTAMSYQPKAMSAASPLPSPAASNMFQTPSPTSLPPLSSPTPVHPTTSSASPYADSPYAQNAVPSPYAQNAVARTLPAAPRSGSFVEHSLMTASPMRAARTFSAPLDSDNAPVMPVALSLETDAPSTNHYPAAASPPKSGAGSSPFAVSDASVVNIFASSSGLPSHCNATATFHANSNTTQAADIFAHPVGATDVNHISGGSPFGNTSVSAADMFASPGAPMTSSVVNPTTSPLATNQTVMQNSLGLTHAAPKSGGSPFGDASRDLVADMFAVPPDATIPVETTIPVHGVATTTMSGDSMATGGMGAPAPHNASMLASTASNLFAGPADAADLFATSTAAATSRENDAAISGDEDDEDDFTEVPLSPRLQRKEMPSAAAPDASTGFNNNNDEMTATSTTAVPNEDAAAPVQRSLLDAIGMPPPPFSKK